MPTVSISQAIKLSGVSRQHFYDAYIKTGKISVDRSDPKRPTIDTSEILRVFGRLHSDSLQKDNPEKTEDTSKTSLLLVEIERLKAENAGLSALAEERKIRISEKDREIEHQRERITALEIRYDRLLEDGQPKHEASKQPARFWDRLISVFKSSY